MAGSGSTTSSSPLDQYQQRLTQMLRQEDAQWKKVLGKLEASSGVAREHIFLGGVGLLSLYLILGGAAQLLCNLIGFAGPAYYSMAAIRSKEPDDDTQWLIYWTVFSLFSLVDQVADAIYSYFPLYWLAKAGFLVWLWHERGSILLWNKVIGPVFDRYQKLTAKGESGASAKGPSLDAAASSGPCYVASHVDGTGSRTHALGSSCGSASSPAGAQADPYSVQYSPQEQLA